MEKNSSRLRRDDWLAAALKRCEHGIEAVKIAPLAADMGVTTGSFYWHFKNRRELLDALLAYWEAEMTDAAVEAARAYDGSPTERILYLMESVATGNLARYDLAFWSWARTDARVSRVFKRVLKKRFEFAAWMFAEAGFEPEQATVRGRMLVVYLMGESTLVPDAMAKRREYLKLKHAVLTAPASESRCP